MEGVKEDMKSLFAKFKHDDKHLSRDQQQLNLKRRWLMGLTMSSNEEKRLKASVLQNDRVMPELFLREDDVHYETIRSSIEKGLRVKEFKRDLPPFEGIIKLHNSRKDIENFLSLLNIMTSKALSRVAEILASGSIEFENIRWKSRKIIKKRIAEVLSNRNNCQPINLSDQLSQLLKDPNMFLYDRGAFSSFPSQSSCDAAEKVLDGLGDLPILALHSMHRKLRGVKGQIPQLQPSRSGWRREKLIETVRNCCIDIISNLHEGDELPEPLMKAMSVASLGFKLIGNEAVEEFQHFSTEIMSLQNKIVKAIMLLDIRKKVSISDLKKMKFFLDPSTELSNKSLRSAIRNLLTEYLFECNDMEVIPESLNQSLNIISGGSLNTRRRSFTKAEVEEEVECVLSVSAQAKQIAWDLLPEHEFDFDQDFADAYVEDLDDSDDGEGWDDDKWLHMNCTNDQLEDMDDTHNSMDSLELEVESVCSAQINSVNFSEPIPLSPSLKSKDFDSQGYRPKSPKTVSSNFSIEKERFMHDEQVMTRNQYLAVQKACDKTSLVAYQIIGNLLNAFTRVQGTELHRDYVSYLRGFNSVLKKIQDIEKASVDPDSVFMKVLQELIPNFTESAKDRARQLMGL